MITLRQGNTYDMEWAERSFRGWLCDHSAATKRAATANWRDWFDARGVYLGKRDGLEPKFA